MRREDDDFILESSRSQFSEADALWGSSPAVGPSRTLTAGPLMTAWAMRGLLAAARERADLCARHVGEPYLVEQFEAARASRFLSPERRHVEHEVHGGEVG